MLIDFGGACVYHSVALQSSWNPPGARKLIRIARIDLVPLQLVRQDRPAARPPDLALLQGDRGLLDERRQDERRPPPDGLPLQSDISDPGLPRDLVLVP